MKFLQKDTWFLILAMLVLFIFSTVAHISIMKSLDRISGVTADSQAESSDSSSSEGASSTSTGDSEIDMSDYVTYFDLAYAAYTNPEKFVGKDITLVGYYSNNLPIDGTTSEDASNSSSEEETETTYHFITTYGQVDECHITAEFTTADGKYPEKIGTVIKITGKFTSYEENGNTYYTIAADTFSTVDT